VRISKNGKELYSRSIGYAAIKGSKKIKAASDTKYRIGSVSKMFTAAMIFQLVEEKKLSLSTPLADFFPQIPNAKTITIGNILNHHSGIHDFTRDSTYMDWMTLPRTHEQMVAAIVAGTPSFLPGEKGEYSNSNYVLLGYIIEKVTGDSYDKELNKRIISKLGLKNTYYGSKMDLKRKEASSFEYDGGKWVEGPETDMSIPGGAGAIVSNPKDLSIFIDGLFKHKLISDSSLGLMMTQTDNYGMGMFKSPFYKKFSFGHTGAIDGFTTALDYYPEDSMVLAMTCNGLNYRMNNIAIGILSIYYDMPYVIPTFKTVEVNPEKLAAYEGVYSSKTIPIKLTIKIDEGTLTAQATGQSAFPLEALSDSKFQFEDAGIEIAFHISEDNKVDRLMITQKGHSDVFEKE
jgi:CubicO group peptidase (beta-lactamase class C family)